MHKMLPVILVALLGCSSDLPDYPDTVPASGTVTQGGQPVDAATVTFHPPEGSEGKHAASATTGADGKFTLRTFFSSAAVAEGAVPGTYKVTVTKVPLPDPNLKTPHGEDVVVRERAETPPAKNQLPKNYESVATSPLEVTIEAGKQDGYDLKLE
jgi:hypothetical protein